jgi:CubicO group peptidase (beta-lactamase class C family)
MTKRAATAALAVVLLALTGCGPAQPLTSPPSPLSDASPNEVSGVAIPAGRIDEAISKARGLVGDLMERTGTPGMSLAMVNGGNILYAKGFSVRDKLGIFTR